MTLRLRHFAPDRVQLSIRSVDIIVIADIDHLVTIVADFADDGPMVHVDADRASARSAELPEMQRGMSRIGLKLAEPPKLFGAASPGSETSIAIAAAEAMSGTSDPVRVREAFRPK